MPKKTLPVTQAVASHLPTASFTFNGATITVRQEIGWDTADSMLGYKKLIEVGAFDLTSESDRNRVLGHFLPAVTRTVSIDGDLGFPWVTVNSPAEDLAAAYVAFGASPALAGGYFSAFIDLNNQVPGNGDVSVKNESPSATTTS